MIYDLQKASMWKRMSAFLFDVILLGIVAVLFAWGLSAVTGFDRHNDALAAAYDRYGEQYGVNFDMTLAEYEAITPEQMDNLNAAYAALSADEEAVYSYNMVIQLTLMITSLGILLGYALMEFAIPMWLGNGQTLGKKIFGVALMHVDGVKVNGRTMFIRTFLGKYAIETMVPVLLIMMIWLGILGLVGTLVALGILAVQGLLLLFNRKRQVIHDVLATTVAVDLASQMIFDSREKMIAYKEKVHAEEVARAAY